MRPHVTSRVKIVTVMLTGGRVRGCRFIHWTNLST